MLQRHDAVFAAGLFFAFGDEHVQASNDFAAGISRINDLVDVAPFGSDVGVGVLLDVFVDELVFALGPISFRVEFAELSAVHDLDRTLWAHDSQFSCGPGERQIRAN